MRLRHQHHGSGRFPVPFEHLSVMMLGLIDTRSVFVPTSAEYFSLIGGMLHLRTAKQPQKNSSDSLDSTFELKVPEHKIGRVDFLPALAVLDDAAVSNHGAFLEL